MGGVGGPYTLCAPHFLLSALEEPRPRRLRPCLACGKLKLSHEIWTVSWTMTKRRKVPLTCPRRLSGRICPRLSGFSASPPPQPSCSQASSCPRREACWRRWRAESASPQFRLLRQFVNAHFTSGKLHGARWIRSHQSTTVHCVRARRRWSRLETLSPDFLSLEAAASRPSSPSCSHHRRLPV